MSISIPLSLQITLNEYDEKTMDYLNACFGGDVEKISRILDETPEIVREAPLGIENACQENRINVIKLLLSKGKMNITAEGSSAILASSYQGHVELTKFLISIGADISVFNNSAIVLASKNGHFEIVKLLTEYGADPCIDSYWCLMLAVLSDVSDFETIKFLINMGCDPKSWNNIALRTSCEKGYVNVLKFLKSLDVPFVNLGGVPMGLAAGNGQLETITLLTEFGCDIHENKNTAFITAISRNQRHALEMLISLVTDNRRINLNELLYYAKNVKNSGIEEPTACISYLKELLHIEDQFPNDVVVNSDECPVCDEISDLILPCRHIICKRCYHLLQRKNCPICRYTIDENLVRKR